MVTKTGTAKADRFDGTAGDDTFTGLGGQDTAYGNGGNDKLYGGDAPDVLIGGAGRDQLWGGNAPDLLDGYEDGPPAADVLRGEGGPDEVYGGRLDTVDGGLGDDRLAGYAGTMTGGTGDDSFDVGADYLYVGNRYVGDAGHTVITDFHHGDDTLYLQIMRDQGGGSGRSLTPVELFDHLDSNGDGRVTGKDVGVTIDADGLHIDDTKAFADLVAWAKGDSSLTLQGVKDGLTADDFGIA